MVHLYAPDKSQPDWATILKDVDSEEKCGAIEEMLTADYPELFSIACQLSLPKLNKGLETLRKEHRVGL